MEIIIACPSCNGTMAIIETMDSVLYICGNCKLELKQEEEKEYKWLD